VTDAEKKEGEAPPELTEEQKAAYAKGLSEVFTNLQVNSALFLLLFLPLATKVLMKW
jgi:hypothetical protein